MSLVGDNDYSDGMANDSDEKMRQQYNVRD